MRKELQALVDAALEVAAECSGVASVDVDSALGRLVTAARRLHKRDKSEPPGRFFIYVGDPR